MSEWPGKGEEHEVKEKLSSANEIYSSYRLKLLCLYEQISATVVKVLPQRRSTQ